MVKQILYFDCFSGVSGDMTVAALLDAGVPEDVLRKALDTLNLPGYRLEITRGTNGGLAGTDFRVILDGDTSGPDHTGDHYHGHEHEHEHDHDHEHEHENEHEPHFHGGEHHHRGLSDILALIEQSGLSKGARELSSRIFRILGEAEARVHGIPVQDVHFHEVGAVDSIVDICGAAVCLDWLGIDDIRSSAVNVGGGTVQTAHGILPVPAPATVEILKDVPVYSSGIMKELATPTGAAILKAVVRDWGHFPALTVSHTGYGLGKRRLNSPNALRVITGTSESEDDRLWVLETNIDDMNPEVYGYLFPLLLESGALDVWCTPAVMKKNRPAQVLSVLCRETERPGLEEKIFLETTTLGIRRTQVQRSVLERKQQTVDTPYGKIRVKTAVMKDGSVRNAPEYEDCARAASEHSVPLLEVMDSARLKARKIN